MLVVKKCDLLGSIPQRDREASRKGYREASRKGYREASRKGYRKSYPMPTKKLGKPY